MRQKIVLIGALIHNPDVWILDEPLTGLDTKSAFELKEMMHDHVKQNKTVLFSTHVLDVADFITNEFEKIQNGESADGDSSGIIAGLDIFLKKIKIFSKPFYSPLRCKTE